MQNELKNKDILICHAECVMHVSHQKVTTIGQKYVIYNIDYEKLRFAIVL